MCIVSGLFTAVGGPHLSTQAGPGVLNRAKLQHVLQCWSPLSFVSLITSFYTNISKNTDMVRNRNLTMKKMYWVMVLKAAEIKTGLQYLVRTAVLFSIADET